MTPRDPERQPSAATSLFAATAVSLALVAGTAIAINLIGTDHASAFPTAPATSPMTSHPAMHGAMSPAMQAMHDAMSPTMQTISDEKPVADMAAMHDQMNTNGTMRRLDEFDGHRIGGGLHARRHHATTTPSAANSPRTTGPPTAPSRWRG